MERKLATVLFADLVDSTSLVVGVDPEVVRRQVSEYFERASQCIEQHGGTVEKFAGDAVMAAFGVPRTHEDDAARAVRAAFAVLDEVHALGLEARIGVEAGEVVVDDADSTFVTGEAVNIAARLQQAAGGGEIVLGPTVRRLAAGAVEVEDAGPLEMKGRPEPLWTWRALRSIDAPRSVATAWFVGREQELELLENVLARTVRDRRAHLVTVFGDAGDRQVEARVGVHGRRRASHCASRPCAPVRRGRHLLAARVDDQGRPRGSSDDAPASEAFEKLRICCESEAVADLLAVALGVLGAAQDGRTTGELAWAVTLWAEQLADAQPLVLVFEDVQWAEDSLLDVVEHLVRTLRNSPVLIVCLARPDLLDSRPTWGGGNARALSIELGPLSPDESRELVDALARAGGRPAGSARARAREGRGQPAVPGGDGPDARQTARES